jgi:hypothetical protein
MLAAITMGGRRLKLGVLTAAKGRTRINTVYSMVHTAIYPYIPMVF